MASPSRLTPRRFAGLLYLGTTCCLAWMLSGCKGGPDHFTLSLENPLSRPLREEAETPSSNQTAAADQDTSRGERSLDINATGSEPVNPVSWSSAVSDRSPPGPSAVWRLEGPSREPADGDEPDRVEAESGAERPERRSLLTFGRPFGLGASQPRHMDAIPADAADAQSANHRAVDPGQSESAASTNWLRRFFSRGQSVLGSNASVRRGQQAEQIRDSKLSPESMSYSPGSYFSQVMIRGRSLERAEQLDEARKVYKRLIDLNPDGYEPYYRLGVIADRQDRDDEALVLYRHAIRLYEKDPDVFHDLGNCLLEQGSFGKAEEALLTAVALSPIDARCRRTLGTIYGYQGRYEEAIEQFRFGDSEASAYYRLSFVLAAQDDFEGVRDCFLLALDADPSHQASRRGLDLLGEPYPGDRPSAAELPGSEVATVRPQTDQVDDRREDSEAASQGSHDVLALLKQACEEVSQARKGRR